MENLLKVIPDKEKARSLLDMVSVRLDSINILEKADIKKFSSKIIEEYYEVLLELITAIMSLDGYRTRSDVTGAHIISINYMRRYKEFGDHEIELMKDMRKKRIGIKYYGRHVSDDYLNRKEKDIKNLITKLKSIAEKKL